MMKKIVAKASFMKGSPRKFRLVAKTLQNMSLEKAIVTARMIQKRTAGALTDVLEQALGNAKNNFKLSPENLVVSSIIIGEGPRFKRQDVHAHGARFGGGVRHKRLSHITVEVEERKQHGK